MNGEVSHGSKPEVALSNFDVVAEGLDHPECVTVSASGTLYAGGEAGQIYRLDCNGPTTVAQTGGFILGLCLDGDDNVYACDQKRHEVVRIAKDGTISAYSTRIEVPNYPVFDSKGNLYVSDSGGWDEHTGRLWRIRPGGLTERLDVAVSSFPNGLALSPDERWLYVVLSQAPSIVRIPLKAGAVTGEAELVFELNEHVPDGIAVLANGDLVVSCYAPDIIYRYSLSDSKLSTVAFDARRVVLAAPTNVVFFGPTLSRLAVASLGRWHIGSAPTALRGSRLNYPRINSIS